MKNLLFPALILISSFGFAQQKTDSLSPVHWSDTITRDQFNEGVILDPAQLILGKEPGAEVFKAGSDPNVASSIMVRGIYSQYSENKPLYVIDGIEGGDLFLIPPREIESIRILKNLSETGFYGSEGTHGVILVTTRQGVKNKRLSLDFNTSVSLGQLTHLPDLLSAQDMREQAQTHQEIFFNDGEASTDWQDELFRTSVSQSYQLGVGGTLKNTTYRISLDHVDQPGNVKGSDRNVTGGQINLTQTALKNKLQVDARASYYHTKSEILNYPVNDWKENIFNQICIHNPTDPVYAPDGSYYESSRAYNYINPAALSDNITREVTNDQVSALLNVRWEIWKRLGIKLSGSLINIQADSLMNRPANAYFDAFYLNREGSVNRTRANLLAGLTYNRCLGEAHFIDLFAGYVFRSISEKYDLTYDYNVPYLDGTYHSTVKYHDHSFRASLDYSYRQKYTLHLMINEEHDQSDIKTIYDSQVQNWGQWMFYPGVSASWNIARERFMDSVNVFSTLLLTGSFGIAGARPNADYFSLYNTGYTNGLLEIEKTTEFTAALDAGFFRNRLMTEIEYYHRTTDNATTRFSQSVPPNLWEFSYANGMKLNNTGIEAKIMSCIDKKKFLWKSMLGFTWNKNEVVSLAEHAGGKSMTLVGSGMLGNDYSLFITSVGNSLLAFNLPVFVRYNNGLPVYQRETGYTYLVYDATRDISDDVYPKYILSWTNSFTILKNVDFSFLLRYVGGHRIFQMTRRTLSDPTFYLNLNTLPDAGTNYDEGVEILPFSDLYLENASYLRLENLTAGYTFFPKNAKWTGSLRIFLSVNNLFTITDYSGYDPSFNPDNPGLDYFNIYPKNRVYTIGISLLI